MATATTEAVGGEQLSDRRERVGWYFYDWANSAFATTGITVFIGPYLTAIAENAQDANGRVHPFCIPVASGSLFAYTISLSVVLPVVGAITDRSPHKKQLLALFAYIGSSATIAMLFLTGDRYLLGALLLLANAIAAIIGGEEHKAEVARWSIVSAGVWWAAFTSIPLIRLRNRRPLEGEARGSVLLDGFRQLGRTLRSLKSYPLSLFFLIAFLVYNDGIQTVITMAAVYADKYLELSQGVRVQT